MTPPPSQFVCEVPHFLSPGGIALRENVFHWFFGVAVGTYATVFVIRDVVPELSDYESVVYALPEELLCLLGKVLAFC